MAPRRQGSVCPQPKISFLVHKYLGSERPVSFEVLAPLRLSLRGSHVQRKFRQRTTLRSKSSTLKGLLYAPIKQKQYLKRTTLCGSKIPLRSIHSKEGRTIALERSVSKKAVKDKRQSTFFSRVGYPCWFLLGLYSVAWLTQESVSSRIFVRKKGISHVQSNGLAQQTPSARFGKEKTCL